MKNENENKNDEFEAIKPIENKKNFSDGLALTNDEINFIETQRQEGNKLEAFKNGYQKLVNETGFAWGVDGTSPLNYPKIGITKVN